MRSKVDRSSAKPVPILLFTVMALFSGCEREPAVTRWRLDFENGWQAYGIERGDGLGVQFARFHWSSERANQEEDTSGDFELVVDGEHFSVWQVDPEVLRANGFTPYSNVHEGHEGWIARYSNSGVVLEFRQQDRRLSGMEIIFSKISFDDDREQFRFDAGQGQVVSGPVSEKDAGVAVGGSYNKIAERFPEW